MKNIVFVICLIAGIYASDVPDSTFIPFIDSIFNLYDSDQFTHVRRVKDKYTYYLSFTCRTLPCSLKDIQKIINNIDSYKDNFHYVRQSEIIYDTLNDSSGHRGFFVVGVPFAVSWYLGRLSSVYSDDSLESNFSIIGHENDSIDRSWKKNVKGWIKVGYHDICMVWRVRDIGNGKSRVALYTILAPKIWIPRWLFKIAAKKVFPGMLTELEAVVTKKE